MRRVLLLIVGSLVLWCLIAIPAQYLLPDSSLELTGLIGVGCLVPAIISLLVVQAFRNRSPEEQLMGALFSIGVRGGLTVGVGVGFYYLSPLVQENTRPALVWGLTFYLIFMMLETVMVYSLVRRMPPPPRQNGS
jgi:hypothetical protein